MKAITVTVLIQNLQKIKGLATKLINEQNPDVMLAQEINLNSESDSDFHTHYTSSPGFNTAIWSKTPITNTNLVYSPYAEFGGIIASTKGITFISFHGYNETHFKSVDELVAHVQAILSIMSTDNDPAVFAGEFNCWTQSHLDAVKNLLEGAGFALKYSWPYPGRTFPLDHAFVRGVTLVKSKHFPSASDHNGALLEFELHA